MKFFVVGTNHRYSPLALRERVSFSRKRRREALCLLKEHAALSSVVIVSTCNRVELYATAESAEAGIEELRRFITQYFELSEATFQLYFYQYVGSQALRHCAYVSSGLDSLIIGETQILYQLKCALHESQQLDYADAFLQEMFSHALACAKSVHRQTKLSQGKVSVASVALDFIKEKIGSFHNKKVLIIGVGKVTQLVLKYLEKEHPDVVFVSNRTFERASNFAAHIGAQAVRFDALGQHLQEADVVITATASPHPIITKDNVTGVGRSGLIIVDLAVPRDVEPGVKEIAGVEVFYLDELDSVIAQNVAQKKYEARTAQHIIDEEVDRLWQTYAQSEREEVLLR